VLFDDLTHHGLPLCGYVDERAKMVNEQAHPIRLEFLLDKRMFGLEADCDKIQGRSQFVKRDPVNAATGAKDVRFCEVHKGKQTMFAIGNINQGLKLSPTLAGGIVAPQYPGSQRSCRHTQVGGSFSDVISGDFPGIRVAQTLFWVEPEFRHKRNSQGKIDRSQTATKRTEDAAFRFYGAQTSNVNWAHASGGGVI
jgi:hypothetical protein